MRVDYGVGNFPKSVIGSDLDKDTDQDLVVANGFNISVLKNKGMGFLP